MRGAVEESGVLTFLHKKFDTDISEDDMLEMNEYVASNKESIIKARDLFFDDISKMVYDSVIEYRCKGNKKILKHSTNMYFPKDIFTLSDDEVFVDCGAFSGDTVFEFIRRTRGRFKAIHAFEPSQKHFNLLINNINKLKLHQGNITLLNEGVWSEPGLLSFFEQDLNLGSSHVSTDSNNAATESVSIKVNTLDAVFADIKPTLIKMDIEGSELEALKGAKDILIKHKPKLAICMYHKCEDFVDIPIFLSEVVPEYKLHVRHHACGYLDTVLYASI